MNSRIYFRKYISEKDFLDYWKIISNKEAMRMNYGRVFTEQEAEQFFSYMLQINQGHEDVGYFKVFQRTTDELMGLGAIVINDDGIEAELEYMLLPEYWGKGYGSEMVEYLLNKVSHTPNLQKITAITEPDNKASKKILLKYGFESQKVYEVDEGSLAEMFMKKVVGCEAFRDKKEVESQH